MGLENRIQVAVIREGEKVVNVCEIVWKNKEQLNELKKQALENQNAKFDEYKKERDSREKSAQEQKSRSLAFGLIITKTAFNDLVDKGKCETTAEFEKMFDDYLIKNGKYDATLEPVGFRKIKELLWR